jgi:hypothetical protein
MITYKPAPTLGECREAARQILGDARDLMADACERGGPKAVADLAYTGMFGGPSREEIAEQYEALLSEAEGKRSERKSPAT